MSCMEKYNNDFPCEFNPRLKAKFDDFLGKCSVLDEKDTGLYALANDALKEEIKSFFYEANEKHGNAVYSKLLQDNSFRKYIKSAGIDCAFLDRIYMLENSPYDFYPTDSFLEKEKLIEGVYNTLKSIYDRKSPEAKVDCISEEKVKTIIKRDDSACCKKEKADTSPSTPDMHFSDEFSQDELFQSFIGDDAIEQSNDDIEKISTENEEGQSRNQVTETNAESQESNESLILKCQNVIFRTLKEDRKIDANQCGEKSCKKIINALKLILPNGLIIKSFRKKNKIFYTLESIDLNYFKRSHSRSKNNYLIAVRGFMSWLMLKPLNEKTDSQASQNDIKNLQTLKCYEAISRIIIAKFGEDYFFYMEGNTPRLIDKKHPSINEFKELIFKLNEDEYLKNRIHIEFSIELNYSYILIKELGIYLHKRIQFSNSATKKKRSRISKLIWRFYKLVLQKSNYCPSAMLNKQ